MYIMLLILTKSYGTNKCLYVKTLLYTSLYPDYTRDALAPYQGRTFFGQRYL